MRDRPADRGLGLDDHQGVSPDVEQPTHEDPEDPIAIVDLRALHVALENGFKRSKSLAK